MISLTRLSGSVFVLNADLVERVDATPDTVVTLVDGTKYVVTESLEEICELVVDYRGAIVARSAALDAERRSQASGRRNRGTGPVRLAAVTPDEGGER
ncbi:flagellar FlbD family protein [Nocardioides panacisoli]|uniref:Flagellar protein FlbD n=1 Tax=Nocardioides panacisoli TaxID=627624 RepID=A0ABP7HT40_9ACTN